MFSFGITMWEILTGEEPYANMHCGAIIGKQPLLFFSTRTNKQEIANVLWLICLLITLSFHFMFWQGGSWRIPFGLLYQKSVILNGRTWWSNAGPWTPPSDLHLLKSQTDCGPCPRPSSKMGPKRAHSRMHRLHFTSLVSR